MYTVLLSVKNRLEVARLGLEIDFSSGTAAVAVVIILVRMFGVGSRSQRGLGLMRLGQAGLS